MIFRQICKILSIVRGLSIALCARVTFVHTSRILEIYKMKKIILINCDICHRMAPMRKLYSLSLTYFQGQILQSKYVENGESQCNSSNSTAGAVQVKANQQEELSDHLHFRNIECCLNVRYFKLFHLYTQALTVSKILKFQIFYFQKVDQDHVLQFSQLRHSMANVNINKNSHICALVLTVLKIKILNLLH